MVTPDAAASRRFFGEVLGWQSRDGQIPGLDYALMSAAGTDVAGFLQKPDDMPAGWTGYICVDDIEAAFAGAIAAGATAIVPVNPIPGVGRFALLIDPTGAPFGIIDYYADFPAPTVPDRGIQGNGWWRELHTGDREKAFAFYSNQFGWVEAGRLPLAPGEFYQIFGYSAEQGRGAMLNDRDAQSPHWLFYFWVDDIDATQDRLEKAGGKVVTGPMQVPDDTWIIHALDPQGILFAVVGKRGEK